MTKEVFLSLKGLQYDLNADQNDFETITPAEYYHRNGNHYLIFDEVTNSTDLIKNRIKFRDDYFEVVKKGAINVNMVFEEKKKNITNYGTPFGEIIVGVDTDKVRMTEEEKRISVQIDYRLDVNYVHMADCKISIDVRDREGGYTLK